LVIVSAAEAPNGPFSQLRTHLRGPICSFHAPPSRSQVQASARELPLAGHTEVLDESGFADWVDEKTKPGSLGPLGAKRLLNFYHTCEKSGLNVWVMEIRLWADLQRGGLDEGCLKSMNELECRRKVGDSAWA